jgi:hypothetical protein
VLNDQRASRHHGDIRWNGHQWEVVDRGSTNGTYVNGMQVHQPYELRLGDRVTIGETTIVLREYSTQSSAPPPKIKDPGRTAEGRALRGVAPVAPPKRAAPQSEVRATGSTSAAVAFWIVQGVIVAAVLCLATGAFLPWLKITGSLSQDLQPLIQGIADIVATLSGPNSMFNISQEIGGLEGYGKLTLAIAVVSMIALVVDIFFFRKSMVPGIVYLVSGLIAAGAIGFDLINYYRYYEQLSDLTLLFGIQLSDVVQVLEHLIEIEITPMIGLPLTIAGLLLLLLGGLGRLIVALLDRNG